MPTSSAKAAREVSCAPFLRRNSTRTESTRFSNHLRLGVSTSRSSSKVLDAAASWKGDAPAAHHNTPHP
jgi:hypothetical protein